MPTKRNRFTHLTTAGNLQDKLLDLAFTLDRLHSLLKVACGLDFDELSNSEDAVEDLLNVAWLATDLAAGASEKCDEAAGQAGGLRQRMEGKPEAGDRLQGETILQMFEALIRRGEGFSAYRLSRLASMLGAHAKHDPGLRSVLDVWIRWMASLGIRTSINKSAERATGEFSIGIVSAPGGADAVIRAT